MRSYIKFVLLIVVMIVVSFGCKSTEKIQSKTPTKKPIVEEPIVHGTPIYLSGTLRGTAMDAPWYFYSEKRVKYLLKNLPLNYKQSGITVRIKGVEKLIDPTKRDRELTIIEIQEVF